jgi:thiol-disulfide isomerase/thioredoxin
MRAMRILAVNGLVMMFFVVCGGCRNKPAEPTDPTKASDQTATPAEQTADPGGKTSAALQGQTASDQETGPSQTSQTERSGQVPADPKRVVREQDVPPKTKPVQIADDEWTMNFEAAKAKATAQKKHLLINFGGSDWCGWCIRLEAEVFGKEDFRRKAGKHFVLVDLDSPRDAQKLSPEIRQQNARLVEQYRIEAYPTILLTDAAGRPYAATGYREGGVDPYLAHLQEFREIGLKVQELLVEATGLTDPIEKAKRLDSALELLEPSLVNQFYAEQIDQIVQLDANNAAGLKNKYIVRKSFGDVQNALTEQDYTKALELLDTMLKTLTLNGEQTQQTHYARAHALHFLQRSAEEKQALDQAVAAAPNSQMAEGLRRLIAQLFPPPPDLAHPGQVATTLQTYQNYIPERAFDGNEKSYFWSAQAVPIGATFTVSLDQPQPVQQIEVTPGGEQLSPFALAAGVLEVSTDGATFEKVADFENGQAQAVVLGKTLKAVRIRCTQPQPQGLVIREITLK